MEKKHWPDGGTTPEHHVMQDPVRYDDNDVGPLNISDQFSKNSPLSPETHRELVEFLGDYSSFEPVVINKPITAEEILQMGKEEKSEEPPPAAVPPPPPPVGPPPAAVPPPPPVGPPIPPPTLISVDFRTLAGMPWNNLTYQQRLAFLVRNGGLNDPAFHNPPRPVVLKRSRSDGFSQNKRQKK